MQIRKRKKVVDGSSAVHFCPEATEGVEMSGYEKLN